MLKFHKQTRIQYWSESKLSKWLRKKAGLVSPIALTMEEWDDHEDKCKKKAPVIHWITNRGFNRIQDIVQFVPDLIWTIRTADIWQYLRNLYVFNKSLWYYRRWDYSGMLHFMEEMAKDMSECHKTKGHTKRADKTAKELLVFAELLKRIRLDNYTEDKLQYVPGKGFGSFVQKPNALPSCRNWKVFYKMVNDQKKADLELATKMMNRSLPSWWD